MSDIQGSKNIKKENAATYTKGSSQIKGGSSGIATISYSEGSAIAESLSEASRKYCETTEISHSTSTCSSSESETIVKNYSKTTGMSRRTTTASSTESGTDNANFSESTGMASSTKDELSGEI